MQFDPSEVQDTEFSLLPEGIHRVMVNSTTLKANKTSDGQHVSVEFGVIDGLNKGRKLWANFNVEHPNETARNIGRAQMKKFLAAIGVTTKIDLVTQLPALAKSKTLFVKVEHEPDYRDKTKMRETITSYDAGPGAAAVAQAPKAVANAADSVPF